MKNMGISYSSAKTADTSYNGGISLSLEQVEAIQHLFAEMRGQGECNILLPNGELFTLHLQGTLSKKAMLESFKLFEGKALSLADTIWEKSVTAILQKSWEGSLSVLNYGTLRHEMSQMARGYESQSRVKRGEERLAYRKIAKRLTVPEEVRRMLTILGKVKSHSVYTFQFLKGQGGKIRIVRILRHEKTLQAICLHYGG